MQFWDCIMVLWIFVCLQTCLILCSLAIIQHSSNRVCAQKALVTWEFIGSVLMSPFCAQWVCCTYGKSQTRVLYEEEALNSHMFAVSQHIEI